MKFQRLIEIINVIDKLDITKEELLNRIPKFLEPRFELNEQNSDVYNQLKLYFSNDNEFNGDLNKGVLILGGLGTGKTLALEIYQVIFGFQMFSSDEVIDAFCKDGRPSIEQFNTEHDIALDDIGQDSGKHYYFGTIEDPMDVLLSRRYDMFKQYKHRTHATTNLSVEALEQRFSPKVFDRMFEMFNIIPLVGDSWRRKHES
jgi:hypothetical protein